MKYALFINAHKKSLIIKKLNNFAHIKNYIGEDCDEAGGALEIKVGNTDFNFYLYESNEFKFSPYSQVHNFNIEDLIGSGKCVLTINDNVPSDIEQKYILNKLKNIIKFN